MYVNMFEGYTRNQKAINGVEINFVLEERSNAVVAELHPFLTEFG